MPRMLVLGLCAGYFLVRGHEGGEPVTVRVHVDRGFLASLGVGHADGLAVVDVCCPERVPIFSLRDEEGVWARPGLSNRIRGLGM